MIGRVVDTGAFSNQWQRDYSVTKLEHEKCRFTTHSLDIFVVGIENG